LVDLATVLILVGVAVFKFILKGGCR